MTEPRHDEGPGVRPETTAILAGRAPAERSLEEINSRTTLNEKKSRQRAPGGASARSWSAVTCCDDEAGGGATPPLAHQGDGVADAAKFSATHEKVINACFGDENTELLWDNAKGRDDVVARALEGGESAWGSDAGV